MRTQARNLDTFTLAYLECALWSSLDDNYGIGDMAQSTIDSAREDCGAFQRDHAELIGDELERAGHGFWLTRNRHGAGFWDGDWPRGVGKILTDAAHAYGSVDLSIGDDGLIYS